MKNSTSHLFFNPVSKKNFDPPTSSLNPPPKEKFQPPHLLLDNSNTVIKYSLITTHVFPSDRRSHGDEKRIARQRGRPGGAGGGGRDGRQVAESSSIEQPRTIGGRKVATATVPWPKRKPKGPKLPQKN